MNAEYSILFSSDKARFWIGERALEGWAIEAGVDPEWYIALPR